MSNLQLNIIRTPALSEISDLVGEHLSKEAAMTAHSFCMLQRDHYKQVKSPLKHQLPPYVGAGPSCQVWHSAHNARQEYKGGRCPAVAPGLTERLQLTLTRILCMDLPTSQ